MMSHLTLRQLLTKLTPKFVSKKRFDEVVKENKMLKLKIKEIGGAYNNIVSMFEKTLARQDALQKRQDLQDKKLDIIGTQAYNLTKPQRAELLDIEVAISKLMFEPSRKKTAFQLIDLTQFNENHE